MKLTDDLVKKFGADKLLHLCIAGWLVSMAQNMGWAFMIIVTVLIIVLSVIKELWLDKGPDWIDLFYSIIGMGISWIAYLLAV